jgi:Zn-dependent metalloprotease
VSCILPPYILDRLAESAKARIRQLARDNIAFAAELRMMRNMLSALPTVAAATAPTAKKHRLVYDLRNRPPFTLQFTRGRLRRSEGQKKTGDLAVDEAYDYSGFTYDFYKKFFNRNSLDDRGMTLVSTVHVGRDFNNAFWNGQQMAYGDGDGEVFTRFTRSLDVVGHELTHGVVDHTSRLEYQGQSGALNEHFADVFGTLVKQWRRKQTADKADWLVGQELLTPAPTRTAIRSLKAPGTAFKDDPDLGDDPQPAHIDNLYTGPADNGGVHINSGIPNHAFYRAATALGGNAWETVGPIWYKTMLALTTTSDFQQCAALTVQFAGAQGAAVAKAVKNAWGAVGINV